MHFGYWRFRNDPYYVKLMDYIIGTYMVTIEPRNRRREFYGMAGSYRPKPYGIEYRVPSAVWVSPEHLANTMNVIRKFDKIITDFDDDNDVLAGVNCDDVREAINEHDVDACRALHEGAMGL